MKKKLFTLAYVLTLMFATNLFMQSFVLQSRALTGCEECEPRVFGSDPHISMTGNDVSLTSFRVTCSGALGGQPCVVAGTWQVTHLDMYGNVVLDYQSCDDVDVNCTGWRTDISGEFTDKDMSALGLVEGEAYEIWFGAYSGGCRNQQTFLDSYDSISFIYGGP